MRKINPIAIVDEVIKIGQLILIQDENLNEESFQSCSKNRTKNSLTKFATFKIVDQPSFPTLKILVDDKIVNVVEEVHYSEILTSGILDFSEILPNYRKIEDLVKDLREYIIEKENGEEKLEYMIKTRELGFESVFDDYFDNHLNNLLKLKSINLTMFSDFVYRSLNMDYLNGEDSRVRDLTIVDGVKHYRLKYDHRDVAEFTSIFFKDEIVKVMKNMI